LSVFSATFSAVAVSAAQDLFEIVAPADSKVAIREIRFGQYTDAGDAAAEILSLLVIKGYTVSGSGGSTLTPANRQGHTGAATSTTTVEANNTTVANTGTAVTVMADAWNVQVPYLYIPDPAERIVINKGERCVVRVTIPADSITMNGTIVFEEVGQ
jgi:hypothetical protein